LIQLSHPRAIGEISFEALLMRRVSRRHFRPGPLTEPQISQILWAAYGYKTHAVSKESSGYEDDSAGEQDAGRPFLDYIRKPVRGTRTCPSAGALYPLDVYLVCGDVEGIDTGFYLYLPEEHAIRLIHERDLRNGLYEACLNQEMIRKSPATLLFTVTYSRVSGRYGDRGMHRYVPMDIGHAAQNVYLQAEALGLGTCAVGAFDDAYVRQVIDLSPEKEPLYLLPIGIPS
jgi:SagB-type dehydrogenase family enzyme